MDMSQRSGLKLCSSWQVVSDNPGVKTNEMRIGSSAEWLSFCI